MDLVFLYRLGLAVSNCMRLLRDRGYQVPDPLGPYETAGFLYKKAKQNKCSLGEAVHETYRRSDGTMLELWAIDRNYDQIKCKERMVSTDQIKMLNESIAKNNSMEHIILCPNKLSPQAKKEQHQGLFLLFDDLLIDIPRHELVLRHTEVSEACMKSFLGPKMTKSDLPILPTSDAVARWYGFKKGSIVFVDNPVMPSFRYVK